MISVNETRGSSGCKIDFPDTLSESEKRVRRCMSWSDDLFVLGCANYSCRSGTGNQKIYYDPRIGINQLYSRVIHAWVTHTAIATYHGMHR